MNRPVCVLALAITLGAAGIVGATAALANPDGGSSPTTAAQLRTVTFAIHKLA